MPQTREHLDILDLLGVSAGLAAITKTDLVEPDLVEFAREEIRELTAGTFLAGCPIVPVSSSTGTGFDQLRAALRQVAASCQCPPPSELFRMAIDRVFSRPGHGTIVTGTVLGGQVQVGDSLELWPAGTRVRVRGLHQHGERSESSTARQRTALNLAGIKADEIRRGDELATPSSLRPTRRMLVSLRALRNSPVQLKDRMSLHLHLATTEIPVRLALKGPPVAAGEHGYAELRLPAPIVAAFGQRFILRLRSPALTIGGGVVLDPCLEPRRRIKDLSARGSAWDRPEEIERLSTALEESDLAPADPLETAWRTGIPPSRYAALIEQLCARGDLRRLSAAPVAPLIHSRRFAVLVAAAQRRIREELARHQPRRALPRHVLLAACQTLAAHDVAEALVQHLRSMGWIVPVGPNLGPADVQVRLTKNQTAARAKMLELIAAAGLTPPTLKELAAALKQEPEPLRELLDLAVEEDALLKVADGLYFTPAALAEARETCRTLLGSGATATMSQLREAWGATRKYSVPLCEYFDAAGILVREGDLRRAGPRLAAP
jgi:selenocysteine-specific elongation factor